MNLSITELSKFLENKGYITEESVNITIFLALKLQKPLLVEGAPGVGKTEIAKVLSQILDVELIRLQCYEGLDEAKALYEWNYKKQLLKIQIMKDDSSTDEIEKDLFGDEYLLSRPLLKAIRSKENPVLLIDEVDKVEPEFEAFLFEVLSDYQVSIPELGTIRSTQIPVVVLTSNGERELSDALKRRCIYLYIDYPSLEKELEILRIKAPEAGNNLRYQVVKLVNYIRENLQLRKNPSIAETIDWARALTAMNYDQLTEENIEKTLNLLLKNHDDQVYLQKECGYEVLLQMCRA
ncbi:MAG: MoxR family ATPase [Clostridiales bacterium]|nr:MoxR family ATPase [Clostridiales bacterium]MCF8021656.1 MoxR family ATPase [Clostridiales bacterium]